MNTVERSDKDPSPEDVIDVLARALQPIVAALQERAIGVGEWIEAVKMASYRAAHEATNAETGRAVFALMSIRTGMTRTELTRLRHRMSQGSRSRREAGRHRLTRVIDGWIGSPEFQDRKGRPLPLTVDGKGPNLRTLARAFAGDVPPVSVIAELQRYQLIRMRGGCYLPVAERRDLGLEGAQEFERFLQPVLPKLMSALEIRLN
jgi:Family of unknown function (DUF6502)